MATLGDIFEIPNDVHQGDFVLRLTEGLSAEQRAEKMKATDAEIDAYIAQHPELDVKQNRSKAEEVLKNTKAAKGVKVAVEGTLDGDTIKVTKLTEVTD